MNVDHSITKDVELQFTLIPIYFLNTSMSDKYKHDDKQDNLVQPFPSTDCQCVVDSDLYL